MALTPEETASLQRTLTLAQDPQASLTAALIQVATIRTTAADTGQTAANRLTAITTICNTILEQHDARLDLIVQNAEDKVTEYTAYATQTGAELDAGP